MDYEKKYNEALNDMRVIYPNLKGDAKLAVEHAFPELRESEDERIRKELIEFIKWSVDRHFMREDFHQAKRPSEWIAYLEKQKEFSEHGYGLYYYHNGGFTLVARPAIEEEKQKEQKPVDDDPLNDPRFIDGFDTGREVQKIFDEPTEWSEEDEKKIGRLRSVVNQLASYTDSLDVNGDYCEGDYAELDTWLKSLSPQPHWKPSEDLMGCLERVMAFKHPEPEDIKGCEELLEQLKKLM